MIMSKQIFCWYGDNDFEIHQKIIYWRKAFEKKYSGLNINYFDLAEAGPKDKFNNDLKNALQVNSLFGMNKLVILKNFMEKSAKLNMDVQEMMIKSFDNLADSFFLVFYQSKKPDARNEIFKQLKKLEKKKSVEIEESKLPRDQQLVVWIKKKASQHGAQFSPPAINSLSALVGNDLWQLDREIHKLAHYNLGGTIEPEDINLLVKGKYNDDIFQLMDAISARNKKKIVELFYDQLASGANEMYLLTMLIRQFRIFWQIQELVEQGGAYSDQIASKLGLHPYVVKKSMSYLRNFDLKQIKKIYNQLLGFDIAVKTKNISLPLMFDLFVAEL